MGMVSRRVSRIDLVERTNENELIRQRTLKASKLLLARQVAQHWHLGASLSLFVIGWKSKPPTNQTRSSPRVAQCVLRRPLSSLFQVNSSTVASRVGVLSTHRDSMTSSKAYRTGPLLFSHDWHVDTPIESAEFGSLGLLC